MTRFLLLFPLVGCAPLGDPGDDPVASARLVGVDAATAIAIVGAALFKIYPLSLGLLLGVIEPRRFVPRLLLVAVIAAALPFAIQSPDYVIGQYNEWLQLVEQDDRTEQPWHQGYHDFRKVLLRWGVPLTLDGYRAVEIVIGCAAAGIVLWGRYRGCDRAWLIQVATSLGFLWCTLFGPATESATYMVLAPIAAHSVLAVRDRAIWERAWIYVVYATLLASNMIHWFPYSISHTIRGTLIPQPHAALILCTWTVFQFVRTRRSAI